MKYFIYAVIIIVAVSVVAGFFVVGSPKGERLRRFDEQRVQNLQMIQSQIGEYYRAKGKLPEALINLNDTFRGFTVPADPDTGKAYEYIYQGPSSFKLCANFSMATVVDSPAYFEKMSVPPGEPMGPFGQENWLHGAGNVCFERTIDPDFFPKLK